MLDSKTLGQLAASFIDNAIEMKAGEKIWLEWCGDAAEPLARACMAHVQSIGGIVHPEARGSLYINKILSTKPSTEELKVLGKQNLEIMKTMDCYIRIGEVGDAELQDDHGDLLCAYQTLAMHECTEERINNTRWLVVRAPSDAFAEMCNMPVKDFEKFYLDAYLFDHSKMVAPATNLKKILEEGRDVHIKGQGTDLKFSIEGIGAKICVGKINLPDGEVFTAPVKGSVNGYVTYGPSVYDGCRFDEIFLRYEDGKIIEAKSSDEKSTAALNKILDTDEGARYPGEFAIAFNPQIHEPMGDILFDEKISGSYHIASGNCYDVTDNGNKSAVHWDMVQIQRPEYGGGTIEIDGRIIRKDGQFVVPELLGLNPDQLLTS